MSVGWCPLGSPAVEVSSCVPKAVMQICLLHARWLVSRTFRERIVLVVAAPTHHAMPGRNDPERHLQATVQGSQKSGDSDDFRNV